MRPYKRKPNTHDYVAWRAKSGKFRLADPDRPATIEVQWTPERQAELRQLWERWLEDDINGQRIVANIE